MRRSKSLSVSIILYYASIYLLHFMILCKLGRWILLINTLPLIDLIKIILLKIISLLRFDQCGKFISSFYPHWSLIHGNIVIMSDSLRVRRVELYQLSIVYVLTKFLGCIRRSIVFIHKLIIPEVLSICICQRSLTIVLIHILCLFNQYLVVIYRFLLGL